jgi:hypothetical protein
MRGYVKRNLSAIKETREMWSYHLTPITLSPWIVRNTYIVTKIKILSPPSRHRLRQTGSPGQLDGVWPLLANEAVNLCTDDAGLVRLQLRRRSNFVPGVPLVHSVPFCGIWQNDPGRQRLQALSIHGVQVHMDHSYRVTKKR